MRKYGLEASRRGFDGVAPQRDLGVVGANLTSVQVSSQPRPPCARTHAHAHVS